MKHTLLAFLILAFVGLGTPVYAANSTPKDGIPRHAKVTLIPEYMAVRPGESLYVVIDQDIEQGWHTYWKNPGDSGETTSVAWEGLDGLVVNDPEFPAPHKIDTGPLSNFGFSGHVRFLQRLDIPSSLTGDKITLKARAMWLVCEEICIPEEMEQSITLNVIGTDALSPPPVNDDLFKQARAAIPKLVPWQGMIEELEQTIILSLRTDAETVKKFEGAKDIFFYPEEWGIILNPPPQTLVIDGEMIQIKMQRDTRPLSDIPSLKGVLTYVTENGTHEAVALDVPLASEPSVAAAVPAPMTTPEPDDNLPLPEDEVTISQALILAILGGLILNLMPCVFPVLSLKALSLVKMSAKEKKHAALHGAVYTSGVLLCFGAIAGTLIALKAAGEEIGWGFQMQDPTVVLLLAYLLFIMAANMSGFFEFKSGMLSNVGQNLTAHHGYLGTFFTGILAVLVATPCTAPFMGTALGFALTQPSFVAVMIFLALGFGLALPYLFLCLVPPARKLLPKPGVWMETFRELMAFPLYASVAWLVWVYAQQVSGMYGVFSGLIGLVLIAFTIWIIRKSARNAAVKLLKYGMMMFAVFFALSIAVLSNMKEFTDKNFSPQTADYEGLEATPYSPENLTQLLEQNEPVFIDMTAAWCITCKVNEQVALETDETHALFADHQVRYVVGDWTNRDPSITKFLREYGRSGVPLYVYYGPKDPVTQKRPEAVVLPQLLTSGLVADVVEGRATE